MGRLVPEEGWKSQRIILTRLRELSGALVAYGWAELDLALLDRRDGGLANIGTPITDYFGRHDPPPLGSNWTRSEAINVLYPALFVAEIGAMTAEQFTAVQEKALQWLHELGVPFWPDALGPLEFCRLVMVGAVRSIEDLVESGRLGPEGFTTRAILWAPQNLVTRRRLGIANTRQAKLAFLRAVQRNLALREEEVSEVAVTLVIDISLPILEVAEEDDPASPLVAELERVTKELMLVLSNCPSAQESGAYLGANSRRRVHQSHRLLGGPI